jgi:hypothetical protein
MRTWCGQAEEENNLLSVREEGVEYRLPPKNTTKKHNMKEKKHKFILALPFFHLFGRMRA